MLVDSAPSNTLASTGRNPIKKRIHSVSGHSVIIIDKTLMQRLGITDEDFLLQSITGGGILLSPCRESGLTGVAD